MVEDKRQTWFGFVLELEIKFKFTNSSQSIVNRAVYGYEEIMIKTVCCVQIRMGVSLELKRNSSI